MGDRPSSGGYAISACNKPIIIIIIIIIIINALRVKLVSTV